MNRTWTKNEILLLKEVYPAKSGNELYSLFPTKTAIAVNSKAKVLGIKKKGFYNIFTPEQDAMIAELFPSMRAKEIANKLGHSIGAIYRRASKLGIEKNPNAVSEYSREAIMRPDHPGRKHLIQKGSIPPNKGKKQKEYMSQEAINRTKATRFKQGTIPPNRRPVGSESLRADGYIWIKTKEGLNSWELKNRVIWEEQFGEIPEGANIQFKDGNRLNCTIENLYLISKSNQMNQNTIHRYPDEIKTAIRRVNKLTKMINENGK